MKILFISPYFGKLPWYFEYFIHCCRFNPKIDFLIITDDRGYNKVLPANVSLIYKTFEEFKIQIAEQLGMKVVVPNTYKLCDYRPAYGLIFQEYLKHYDFWGNIDIDVVFGNIEKFISKSILAKNDVISIRPEYISGFFFLYRNSESVNHLFKKSKDYKLIFSSSNYTGFDECGLLCDDLLDGKDINQLESNIESMTHLLKKMSHEKSIKAHFDLHVVEGTPGNLTWNRGKLTYLDTYEILLYHLISFKVHPNLQIPVWDSIPDKFSINEVSFSKTNNR